MKQDLCKLGYTYTLTVPLQSKTNDFQSEVGFAHASDIYFCPFKIHVSDIRDEWLDMGMYALFYTKKRRKTCAW